MSSAVCQMLCFMLIAQELTQAERSYRKALDLDVDNKHGVMQKLGLLLYRQGKLAVSNNAGPNPMRDVTTCT